MEEAFRALGDATRLKIIHMLAQDGETCVCFIVAKLGMGQPVVSHHLAVLKRAGLVNARKQGQWIYYSLNVDALETGLVAPLNDIVIAARSTKISEPEATCCG